MATKAYIDRTTTLECIERGGVIVGLTRSARVTGLEEEDLTDHQVLWAALEAAEIPRPHSYPEGDGFEMLVLTDRTATLVSEDTGTVDVTLVYDHIIDHQELSFNAEEMDQEIAVGGIGSEGVIYARVRSAAQQHKTNFYVDWNELDENPEMVGPPTRRQAVVRHTFPTSKQDSGMAGVPDVQGGELEATKSKSNLQFGGYMHVDNPWDVKNKLLNKVNKVRWANHGPREWKCIEVSFHCLMKGFMDANDNWVQPRYRFSFEFEHDPDTHDIRIVYIDRRTGKPPEELVEGVGYKDIKYFYAVDFQAIFGAYIEVFEDLG